MKSKEKKEGIVIPKKWRRNRGRTLGYIRNLERTRCSRIKQIKKYSKSVTDRK